MFSLHGAFSHCLRPRLLTLLHLPVDDAGRLCTAMPGMQAPSRPTWAVSTPSSPSSYSDYETSSDLQHPPAVSNPSLLLGLAWKLTLPAHPRRIPGAFAAFPETPAFRTGQGRVAGAAVFGAVVLFSGACGAVVLAVDP